MELHNGQAQSLDTHLHGNFFAGLSPSPSNAALRQTIHALAMPVILQGPVQAGGWLRNYIDIATARHDSVDSYVEYKSSALSGSIEYFKLNLTMNRQKWRDGHRYE